MLQDHTWKLEVTEENDLTKTQEEADTRVIIHAKHAAPAMPSIIIVAEDTDIILLSLAFQKDIDCDIYFKCDSTTHTRFINMR